MYTNLRDAPTFVYIQHSVNQIWISIYSRLVSSAGQKIGGQKDGEESGSGRKIYLQ